MTHNMKFERTLSAINSEQFSEILFAELKTNVFIMDVRGLTRCGGHASDPELVSVISHSLDEKELTVECEIKFSDGSALDCSGQCGGDVTQRSEVLRIKISRRGGSASWETLDGVIAGY